MRKRSILILSVCLAVGIAIGWAVVSGHVGFSPSAAAADKQATPVPEPKLEPAKVPIDDAVIGQCGAYAKAFNAGDAKAVAALFNPDAEMTGIDGITIRGRVAIEAEYAALFKANPGLMITVEPGNSRTLGDSLRVVEGVIKVKKPGDRDESVAIYSALLAKEAEGWKIATVKEYEVDADSGMLSDLDWLVGTWTGKCDDTALTATYSWVDGKAFLQCKYTVKKGDAVASQGTQMIGETSEGVKGWLFDSGGSTGESRWTKEGRTWTIVASGEIAGVPSEVTHVLVKLGDTTITWQSIDRTINGVAHPDGKPMKLTKTPIQK